MGCIPVDQKEKGGGEASKSVDQGKGGQGGGSKKSALESGKRGGKPK